MPELGEVEFNRRQWDPGLGRTILRVTLHPQVRDFRGVDPASFPSLLEGRTLLSSEARGKLIGFRLSGSVWLGVHLGMTGHLRIETGPPVETGSPAKAGAGTVDSRHDHLRLQQKSQALVFRDPRQFGRLLLTRSATEPSWWSDLPPALLSRRFTVRGVRDFLYRHARAPIKGVLLMQEQFPGLGNWMADEVLWRSAIHPARPAGSLTDGEIAILRREIRTVARVSLRRIGETYGKLPKNWLFHYRWNDGGICPRSGAPLVRERIGGRTTCWSPGVQQL